MIEDKPGRAELVKADEPSMSKLPYTKATLTKLGSVEEMTTGGLIKGAPDFMSLIGTF